MRGELVSRVIAWLFKRLELIGPRARACILGTDGMLSEKPVAKRYLFFYTLQAGTLQIPHGRNGNYEIRKVFLMEKPKQTEGFLSRPF